MAHELQRLQSKHHHMIDLCLMGLDRNGIAQATEMTPEGVGGVINSPLFQQELARRRENQNRKVDDVVIGGGTARAMEMLQANATTAADTLIQLAKGATNEGVRRQSASDILDRVFGKDSNGPQNVVVINADKMILLQQVLAEDKDDDKENEDDLIDAAATASIEV